MTVSDQRCSQLTPGVEQSFVDGIAARLKLDHEGIKRNTVDDDGDEDSPLSIRQFNVNGFLQCANEISPLRLSGGVESKTVGQSLPVLGIECHTLGAPEVSPDFRRQLENGELACPGRKAALASELLDLARNGEEGVTGGLIDEIIEFRSGDPNSIAAPTRFAACDSQEQIAQSRQRIVSLVSLARQTTNPFSGLWVLREQGSDP
jgi:hypothetical protein